MISSWAVGVNNNFAQSDDKGYYNAPGGSYTVCCTFFNLFVLMFHLRYILYCISGVLILMVF